MSRSDFEIVQGLTEAISLMVPQTFGTNFELAPIQPARLDRRYSFIFRYWITNGDGELKPILVKIPHDAWMKTMEEAIASDHILNVVKSEFNTMTTIADVITECGESGLAVIHPGTFSTEFNAIMMEEISIRMLKTSLSALPIVLGFGRKWKIFESHLTLAGVWLRVIHDRFKEDVTTSIMEVGVQNEIEEELKRLEKTQAWPLNELRDYFFQLFDLVKTIQLPLTSLHNDYHLGNIFITEDGRVGALDPNWRVGGLGYEDLSSLIIDPVTRKLQVMSLGLQFRPSMRSRYEKAVLRGYFSDLEFSYPLLYLYCALGVLVKWRTNEEVLRSGGRRLNVVAASLAAPLIRSYFLGLIKDYLLKGLRMAQRDSTRI